MTNYTDIPTGEEQGLISETTSIMKKVTKKDQNFYLKLACVGLLCVVAFMSGTGVRARNSAASMVNSYWGNCQAVSSTRADGFCPDGVDPPCISQSPGVDECVQQGGGHVSCLDPGKADEFIMLLTDFSPPGVFVNGWQKQSCEERGYPNFERTFDYGSALSHFIRDLLMMRYGLDSFCLIFRK